MNLSLIVALSDNQAIGRNGDLPWKLSSDLRRFKSLTMGHHVILGRKTFHSIGRPLPGRKFIVMTRDGSFESDFAVGVGSREAALQAAADDDQPFVIGGAEIYREFLPLVETLYVTRVHAEVEDGDAFFPELDERDWVVVEQEELPAGERDQFATTFQVLKRARPIRSRDG
jgi:dihydrofolate reductase